MKLFLSALCLLLSLPAVAQSCFSSVEPSTETNRFVVNDDGTVTDSQTGLQWMQCSLGQQWQNASCIGDASELSWQQALQQAHGYQFADTLGWRLPNIKELASISERACVRPAINAEVFPNTRGDDYWTSTPSTLDPNRAWVVSFDNASNALKQKQLFVFVRLVRVAD